MPSAPTATYCLLPTTYFSDGRRTDCYLLLTAYYLPPTTYYSDGRRTDCTKDVPLLLLSLSAAKRMCCTCEVKG